MSDAREGISPRNQCAAAERVLCIGLRLLLACLLAGLAWVVCPATVYGEGPAWGDAVRVATNADTPAAVLDSQGRIHLAWIDQDGVVKHLLVGSSMSTISSPGGGINAYPSLAADNGGRVHAVWDMGGWVFYACWNGVDWSIPITLPQVVSLQPMVAGEAQVVVDEQGRPHVVFFAHQPGNDFVYVPYYTGLGGGHWLTPRPLPADVPGNTRLSFLVHDSRVHVAFLYPETLRSVGYVTSLDGGLGWSQREDVSGGRSPVWVSVRPSLVLQEGQEWVPVAAWVSRDPQSGDLSSWYARRLDGRWSAPARLVRALGDQRDLVVSPDGEQLFVAWPGNGTGGSQPIYVTNMDLNTGVAAAPTTFDGRGQLSSLTAAVRPDGAAVVVWRTGAKEIYYAYHPPYRPSSAVASLPEVTTAFSFLVRWSGVDRSGTGIHCYDIQVKDGDGPWTDWRTCTPATSAVYAGARDGHTYYFRSRAIDNAGHTEVWPDTYDAVTTVHLASAPVGCYLPLTIR